MKLLLKNREMLLVVAIIALLALIALRFPPFVAPGNLANVYNDTSILIILALAVVAILVDRRALLVSGLVYAGWAFASLFRTIGFKDYTGPVTVLLLGAFVLLLSAGCTKKSHSPRSFVPRSATNPALRSHSTGSRA